MVSERSSLSPLVSTMQSVLTMMSVNDHPLPAAWTARPDCSAVRTIATSSSIEPGSNVKLGVTVTFCAQLV